jgi:hypothetical protein
VTPRRWHKKLAVGVALTAGVAFLGAVWIIATGLLARSDLDALQHDAKSLRVELEAGDTVAAHRTLLQAQADAASARSHTTGPAWWTASRIPVLGSPLRALRGIAAAGREISRTVLPLAVTGGAALDPQQLRAARDHIDLGRLEQAQEPLALALSSLRLTQDRLAALPGGWISPIASARQSLLRELTSLEAPLRDSVAATQLLPAMLGGDGPRRYLVVFEGDNEARGVGGILGGYGVLVADDGTPRFERFGTDVDLERISADIDLGPDFDALYQRPDHAYNFIGNADLSPNFPYAAQIWSSMWEKRFGGRLDGVLAVDPSAMAEMLGVIGDVHLEDGTLLTRGNLVPTLDLRVYQRFGTNAVARKAFFVAAAEGVVNAVLHRSFSTSRMLRVLNAAVDQGRFLIYSAAPAEQQELEGTALAGAVPITRRPYNNVIINNASGTKLDYYLRRSVTYQRESCRAGRATVTIQLTNGAPASGLPIYMTRGKGWIGPHPAGTVMELVSLYGTAGSTVVGAKLDGHGEFIANGNERGHPVSSLLVTLTPGQTRTVVFNVDEPSATGPAILPAQPLDQPMTVRAAGPSCPAS